MSEQAGSKPYGGANRHHKPKPFAPIDFEPFAGGADPARVSEAAHLAAQALVRHGRDSDDPVITERLVRLADEQGLEAIAEMWAESPARSLPGALWRLYALRAATVQDPERISVYFRAGKDTAQVSNVVAGVAEPPGADEMRTMADAVLSGAFDGEFDVALERSAAFCRVVALGQVTLADGAEHANEAHASRLTRNSHQLVKTAEDLEHAANAWRLGELD
ncbi:hypothetical protein OVA06_16710 [Pseudarthrobacter sp. SL88]|uniref:DNA-directed RNA polymerase subunit beta n=1 Tax=Pseudarthrobacter equi TaxID=728066 RepID=A0A1H1UBY2_9MICC|nr:MULTISPECIES: hypothetical protein [Micrococcaceae]MDQ1053651.1 hypothetical protein [Arthrobacter sp. SORGH_AS_0212]KQQ82349.1 hypothetical protein ASF64_10235 [Arthrobacter sp. Leaf137]MCT9623544.1 hypothetical protein [Pseudarthrobacter equi]MCY1676321.1 hypothetical protein [Pseudarthrobacter sp. SL88]SDS69791.1 hypothetical protein SAMN04489743_0639 [Pseudarthrobacter equi]